MFSRCKSFRHLRAPHRPTSSSSARLLLARSVKATPTARRDWSMTRKIGNQGAWLISVGEQRGGGTRKRQKC
ncbi:uncharacterized [Tachysurus ichikawai]